LAVFIHSLIKENNVHEKFDSLPNEKMVGIHKNERH